ncbi:hypothetical protein VVD49_01280 [Uliginosibacterium sp. H3]|uniref:Uncharacterized protein n=1 Tax=Uliginosibacterium silvisoli TaxID=3114758 RepID=A0ABU6JY56_9RHOO|nr:hypothetical protein [Uliginosibacterium sp. H3]
MTGNLIKRAGAGSLIALHVASFPAWAAVCSANSGLGAVFSVMGDGQINLKNDGENGQCNPTFYNASQVNAKPGKLVMSGTDANKKNCQSYASAGDITSNTSKSLSLSGSSVDPRVLPTYVESSSAFDISFPNSGQIQYGNTLGGNANANGNGPYTLTLDGRTVAITKAGSVYTLPGGEYDQISISNGISVVFSAPVRIKRLSMNGCNGAGVTFAQDVEAALISQTNVNQIDWAAGCNVSTAGPGQTTLNVLGKSTVSSTTAFGLTLNGGPTCVNYTDCAAEKTWSNMDSQHPERLQINVYNGSLTTQGNFSLSAGVYVAEGDFNMGNGSPVTIVGEILAKNVIAQNNSQTKFFSKNTSVATPRTGAYSLTPPITEQVTQKDSLVYRALQKDLPGTSGHLQAFRLKDDSSQETTADWDAADVSASKMSSENRLSKLRTEASNWASASTGFVALSNTASGATLAQACAVNPTQDACRLTGDKRSATSMVGVPWRVTPMLLGDSVLFATDDGILYSVDKTNGNLNWGWIPGAVLAESQAALTSVPKKLMEAHPWGQIASVQVLEDDPTSSTGGKLLKTYVTGTALGGKLHFSIEVANDGKSLNRVVWLDSRSDEYSPGSAGNTNDGEAGWANGVYGRPYGGAAPLPAVMGGNKVAYVVGGKLVTRAVNAAATPTENTFSTGVDAPTAFNVTPTSNLLYVDDNAIYFGAGDGHVYKTTSAGRIEQATEGVEDLATQPAAVAASAVWYVNGTRIASASGNGLVLLAQTKYYVTAMRYFSDKWAVAWRTGINPGTKLGESSSDTNPTISVLATDNAYLSAPADIINGAVVLYYTKKPSECDIQGYVFGPLNVLDGTDAKGNSQFRLSDMTSLNNYVGKGDATGGAFTQFKGKRAILAGTGGDPGNLGDTAAIAPPASAYRERLNWRELTNFF